jgi:hypothetical protein
VLSITLHYNRRNCSQAAIKLKTHRGSGLRERGFEIKNLCELCVLCGESYFPIWLRLCCARAPEKNMVTSDNHFSLCGSVKVTFFGKFHNLLYRSKIKSP